MKRTIVILELQTYGNCSSVNAIEDDKLTLEDLFQQDLERLHYTNLYWKSQSTFQGGAIAITGIVNNVSTTAREYGVPKLTPEKSTNLSLGLELQLTVDYYTIKVKTESFR
jgi:iron complex outermembrane receptor protein